jgi:hypothetical protein
MFPTNQWNEAMRFLLHTEYTNIRTGDLQAALNTTRIRKGRDARINYTCQHGYYGNVKRKRNF